MKRAEAASALTRAWYDLAAAMSEPAPHARLRLERAWGEVRLAYHRLAALTMLDLGPDVEVRRDPGTLDKYTARWRARQPGVRERHEAEAAKRRAYAIERHDLACRAEERAILIRDQFEGDGACDFGLALVVGFAEWHAAKARALATEASEWADEVVVLAARTRYAAEAPLEVWPVNLPPPPPSKS